MHINTKEGEIWWWTCTHLPRQHQPQNEQEYSFNTMECADFSTKLPSKTIHLRLIYRPPDGSVLQFCQKLTTYLEQNINTTGDTLLMGDINIHTLDPENQDTITFEDTIESLWLRIKLVFQLTDFKIHWIKLLLLKAQALFQTLIKAHLFQTIILSTKY